MAGILAHLFHWCFYSNIAIFPCGLMQCQKAVLLEFLLETLFHSIHSCFSQLVYSSRQSPRVARCYARFQKRVRHDWLFWYACYGLGWRISKLFSSFPLSVQHQHFHPDKRLKIGTRLEFLLWALPISLLVAQLLLSGYKGEAICEKITKIYHVLE